MKQSKTFRTQIIHLETEKDLHYKVVDFIRTWYPEAIVIAGLGEMQDGTWKRIDGWRKGYTKGQPDLILLNKSGPYIGLAIELKSPSGGTLRESQDAFLKRLQEGGFRTLCSGKYDELIMTIIEHMRNALRFCTTCRRWTSTRHIHSSTSDPAAAHPDCPEEALDPSAIDASHSPIAGERSPTAEHENVYALPSYAAVEPDSEV